METMGDRRLKFNRADFKESLQIKRKPQEILRARNMFAALTIVMGIAGSESIATTKEAQANSTQGKQEEKQRDPSSSNDELHYARSLSRAFREVAKRVGPSVVSITTIDRAPFSSEFGRSNPNTSPESPRTPRNTRPQGERRGEGTGIVYSEAGLIITNNHVVAGGDEIIVRLSDGRELTATKIGADPDTDLAVIRVDAKELHAATFGDSNAIETGDWVLAIGCPFGFEHTVTAGIVSAKGRAGVGLSTFEEYIQTDAAINPGNSGGPLIDLDGNVVGINSGIASQSGGSVGVGFAIPSHVVKRIAESIAQGHTVRRGWLGVSTQAMDRDLAKSFSRATSDGVLVSRVVSGTPAAQAGLEVGDIIVAIDGKSTQTPAEFMRTISNYAPNTPISLALIRDGKQVTTDATLGERPSATATASTPDPVPSGIDESLGLEIRTLDTDSATALGANGEGVYVVSTIEGGPASTAGMVPGDVIHEVNGITITDVQTCHAAFARLKNSPIIRILFEREGTMRFTMVKRLP